MILMAGKYMNLLALLAVATTLTHSWELPNLPSGKRTQYFVLHDDGGYKYGYDTGIDHFGKQAGDSNNEVAGHYVYKAANGQDVDIKYTAGVNGFIPEGLEQLAQHTAESYAAAHAYSAYPAPKSSFEASTDDQANTGDASYSFTIDTDTYKRQESSDPRGNVQGKYSYSNEAGQHDLTYIAGENTGFVATSGSLSHANGLQGKNVPVHPTTYTAQSRSGYAPSFTAPSGTVFNDGSYKFEYSTGDQSRQESSDTAGNVQGRYSFTNEAGTHDLSYVAGSQTGFQPTGGSLAIPNGILKTGSAATPTTYSAYKPSVSTYHSNVPNTDGSYSFEYSTGDQSRQESSDTSGNVQGRYSFTNEAGTHDLSYVAGSQTGFQATGGSLSIPNGLAGKPVPSTYSSGSVSQSTGYHYKAPVTSYSSADEDDQANTGDASYSFTIDTDDYKRQETSDPQGNVKGSYSFKNEAGNHDLSFVAGSETGFLPTGGSLSVPNGMGDKAAATSYSAHGSSGSSHSTGYQYNPPVTTYSHQDDDESSTGDASYSFTIDTDDYKRQETSDPQGNVKGSYSFRNEAGNHDLSFVAGSETGFLPTGGSLSVPNGMGDKATATSYSSHGSSGSAHSTGYHYKPPVTTYSHKDDDESNTGDASYSFTIDTDDYKRQETSDSQGNVKGTYSYKNVAGTHDLAFVAGSDTGFLPTGGSLAAPNGLEGKNVPQSGSVLSRSYIQSTGSFPTEEQNSGDASYSFSIDTDDYTRKESADAAGNVKGVYSYKNIAGTHDLSYSAGASTGFVPVSGSLSAPNGLSGPYGAPDYIPPQVKMSDFAKTKAEFSHGKVGNVFLKHYYPSKSQSKYGYIFESA